MNEGGLALAFVSALARRHPVALHVHLDHFQLQRFVFGLQLLLVGLQLFYFVQQPVNVVLHFFGLIDMHLLSLVELGLQFLVGLDRLGVDLCKMMHLHPGVDQLFLGFLELLRLFVIIVCNNF